MLRMLPSGVVESGPWQGDSPVFLLNQSSRFSHELERSSGGAGSFAIQNGEFLEISGHFLSPTWPWRMCNGAVSIWGMIWGVKGELRTSACALRHPDPRTTKRKLSGFGHFSHNIRGFWALCARFGPLIFAIGLPHLPLMFGRREGLFESPEGGCRGCFRVRTVESFFYLK